MHSDHRNHRTRSSRTGAWLATLLAGVCLFSLAPTSASAAYDHVSCWTASRGYCATRPIPAHSSEHWVHVTVIEFSEWWVLDLDTGVYVGHGSNVGFNQFIRGLYGQRYQLIVRAGNTVAGGGGHLANCTSGCLNFD